MGKTLSLDNEDDSKIVAGSENPQSIGDGDRTVTEMRQSDLNVMIETRKSSNMGSVAMMDDSTRTKSEDNKNNNPEKNFFE